MQDVQIIVIADQNSEAERTLASAIQGTDDLNTPHETLHVSEVGRIKERIRAVPAVGVLMLASTLQEAVEIEQIIKAASLLEARDVALEIVGTRATDEEALAMPHGVYREWIGRDDAAGVEGMGPIAADEIVWLRSNDTLYRSPTGVTVPLASQPPDGEGMLAVYAPIRPGGGTEALPWLYGETGLGLGALRIDPTDGLTYEVYNPSGPGANIYEPHLVPAIWRTPPQLS